jgi:predicted signal transduction protein with EAL and GGDEF domain
MSMGISTFPVDAEEKKMLIERADQALYYAKEHGRNRICLFRDIKDQIHDELHDEMQDELPDESPNKSTADGLENKPQGDRA